MNEPIIFGSLKWIGEKALDLLAERLGKKILKEMDPELIGIKEELKDIRNTQEEMLIAPLAEGLRLLRLREFDKAGDKLIEAESKNPHAPIPKIWLALTLAHLQKDREQSVELLSKALEINPYCILDRSEELGEQIQAAIPLTPAAKPQPVLNDWSLSLDDREFVDDLAARFRWPKKLIQRYLSPYSSRSTAAIATASVCGDYIGIQWLISENLRHKSEEALAIFDFKSPQPLWAHLNHKEDLVFLSYRYAVVRLRERKMHCLLDLTNGDSVRRMSDNYFQVMFGGWNAGGATVAKSNWQGTPPTEAYEKSAHFLEPRVVSTDTTFGHDPRSYDEGGTLRDPFGTNNDFLKVQNKWTHVHFAGGANTFPNCRLIGDGKIVSGNSSGGKQLEHA